jgi:hypothetical protein
MATEPRKDLVDACGGNGPRYCEVAMCCDKSEEDARQTAHKFFRWSLTGWPVQAELPDPKGFDAASKNLSPEIVAEKEFLRTIGREASGRDRQVHRCRVRPYCARADRAEVAAASQRADRRQAASELALSLSLTLTSRRPRSKASTAASSGVQVRPAYSAAAFTSTIASAAERSSMGYGHATAVSRQQSATIPTLARFNRNAGVCDRKPVEAERSRRNPGSARHLATPRAEFALDVRQVVIDEQGIFLPQPSKLTLYRLQLLI